MKLTRTFFFAILATTMLSATTQAAPANEALDYKPKDTSTKKMPKLNTVCNFIFDEFQDGRQNKETIGTNFAQALYSNGLTQWLSAAKTDNWTKAINNGADKSITIKPTLTRLYAYPQGMNIIGVMAYHIDFLQNNKIIASKKYRANGTKTNMMNAVGEYYTAVNYAAHSAMPLLLDDLNGVCSQAK